MTSNPQPNVIATDTERTQVSYTAPPQFPPAAHIARTNPPAFFPQRLQKGKIRHPVVSTSSVSNSSWAITTAAGWVVNATYAKRGMGPRRMSDDEVHIQAVLEKLLEDGGVPGVDDVHQGFI
jgi:hypothetical protein